MKKILYKIAPALMGLLMLSSCGDFDNINVDPSKPSQGQAYSEFLFSFSERYVPYFVMQRSYDPEFLLFPRYIAERQNVQYGRYNITTFASTNYYRYTLMNLKKIINMNENESTKNTTAVTSFGSNANQIATARTLMDYYYLGLTDALGMIPYSEALLGDSANYTPKLDTQEEVYKGVMKDLEEAYSQFDASGSLNSTYDYIYKGDISKWKKLNATLRMMAAIKLSDVDPEDGKAWFLQAYKDGGIVSNDDNFTYTFYGNADNENPMYTNIYTEGRKDFAPSSDIINIMNNLKDPRRAAYFVINSDSVYKGIPLGITSSDVTKYNTDNSDFNPNLYKQNEPIIIFSAARTLLVESEAAVRGWIDADAQSLYEEGIKLSIAAKYNMYAGTATSAVMKVGTKAVSYTTPSAPTDDEVEAYLNSTGVKFEGTAAEKIALIATQRYINGFFEDGIETWSDWRRLDAPALTIGPSSLVDHIPYRCTYDDADISTNSDNYAAAAKIQGENTVDTRVWWDKTDNAPQSKE